MMGRGFEVQGPHRQPNTSKRVILKTWATIVKRNSHDYTRKCACYLPGHLLRTGGVLTGSPSNTERVLRPVTGLARLPTVFRSTTSPHPAIPRKPCRHIPGTTLLHRRSSTAHAGVSPLASARPPEMWGSARGCAPALTPRLSPARPGRESATDARERGATARPSAGSWRHPCPSRQKPVPPIISPKPHCTLPPPQEPP